MTEIRLRDGRLRRIFRIRVQLIPPAPDAFSAMSRRWTTIQLPEPDPGFHRLTNATRFFLHDPDNWNSFTAEWFDEEWNPGSGQEMTESFVQHQFAMATTRGFEHLAIGPSGEALIYPPINQRLPTQQDYDDFLNQMVAMLGIPPRLL